MFERVRTINGRQYRYEEHRWREGKNVRSQSIYLGPVIDELPSTPPPLDVSSNNPPPKRRGMFAAALDIPGDVDWGATLLGRREDKGMIAAERAMAKFEKEKENALPKESVEAKQTASESAEPSPAEAPAAEATAAEV